MPYEDEYKEWLEKSLIEMSPDWVCDCMVDNEFTHKWCEENCGKDNAYIMPKCLHMYYHHIARADRKTEPQTEPTWEQVKEYCNKRCLDIVDSALRKKWYKDEPQTDCSWK